MECDAGPRSAVGPARRRGHRRARRRRSTTTWAACRACTAWSDELATLHRMVRVREAEPVPDLSAAIVEAFAPSAGRPPAGRARPAGRPSASPSAGPGGPCSSWPSPSSCWPRRPCLGDDPGATVHVARELGSFDVALAVGLLVAAWQPARAWGLLPVAAALAVRHGRHRGRSTSSTGGPARSARPTTCSTSPAWPLLVARSPDDARPAPCRPADASPPRLTRRGAARSLRRALVRRPAPGHGAGPAERPRHPGRRRPAGRGPARREPGRGAPHLQRARVGVARRRPGARPRRRAGSTAARSAPTGAEVAVDLAPDLPDGTYVVTYRIVSADGHPVRGVVASSPSATPRSTRPSPARPGPAATTGRGRSSATSGAASPTPGRSSPPAARRSCCSPTAAGPSARRLRRLVLGRRGGRRRRVARRPPGAGRARHRQGPRLAVRGRRARRGDSTTASASASALCLAGLVVAVARCSSAARGRRAGRRPRSRRRRSRPTGHTRVGDLATLATVADAVHLVVVAVWGGGAGAPLADAALAPPGRPRAGRRRHGRRSCCASPPWPRSPSSPPGSPASFLAWDEVRSIHAPHQHRLRPAPARQGRRSSR